MSDIWFGIVWIGGWGAVRTGVCHEMLFDSLFFQVFGAIGPGLVVCRNGRFAICIRFSLKRTIFYMRAPDDDLFFQTRPRRSSAKRRNCTARSWQAYPC